MSIQRNDIPILEYDTDPLALFTPDSEHKGLRLPERAVFAFLGEAVDKYAERHGAKVADRFITIAKDYPIYVLEVNGQQICLAEAPVGAPGAAMILDCLIACGVRKIISGGSCGVLADMEENEFLVPRRALRDEGTSYHYLPPSRYVDVPAEASEAVEKALSARGLHWSEVTTWSTDGYFRETREMVAHRKSEGCATVEMECAALAACAQFRGAVWGELLFTADTLADAEHYDARGFGRDSVDLALELCIEAVLNM